MAVIAPTSGKSRNWLEVVRRVVDNAWWGQTNNAEQPPDVLNNESLLAVNAAGTGTVGLLKADASNVVTAPNGLTIPTGKTLTTVGTYVYYTEPNLQLTESGANNAIAAALVDGNGTNVTLAAGLVVTVKLAHTLQIGANTFNLNGGGAVNIKSSRNPANNIATGYAVGGFIALLYDGTQWLDCSQ